MQSNNFRYHSVDEWNRHNRDQYFITKERGIRAEKLIEESDRIRERVKELISKKKGETEWLFKGRIKDIEFLRTELESVRKSIQNELEALEIIQERIQDEMKCIKGNAGEIVQKCIHFRKGRQGIDLIHDEVEKELEIEREKIRDSGELLNKALEQAKECKRELRASMYLLNKDVKDKLGCLTIEIECLNLKESDGDLQVRAGFENLDNANITVQEWARYSKEIMNSSEKKIQSSRLFEANVKILLEKIINELLDQFYLVNDTFQRRILEIKESKLKLEDQHHEIVRQINEMNQNISNLAKSIEEKKGILALAQTRLEKRSYRPGIELVKDRVEESLKSEILEIKNSVLKLQILHSEAEKSLRNLLEAQLQLEEEINIKTNSIKIDEVDCLTIRQSIDYHSF